MTTEHYNEICSFLRHLLEGTPWEGHVYTVGGCCRDMLMGEPINDIDLAVSLPDGGVALAEWLRKKKLTIGEPIYFRKYGTARLHLKAFPKDELELVQTRREKYTDRTTRNPSVAFGPIEDDCLRRDLTINSLYHDISTGEILDITGCGISDIKAHRIRTPMEPDATFDDDPVRILRAIRFAAKYGWQLDDATVDAMTRHSHRLEIISPERLYGEFEKILTGARPAFALDLLRHVGAMQIIIPELAPTFDMTQSDYHFGTVWQHTIATVEGVPGTPVLRMAALLHDIGKTISRTVDKNGAIRFPRHDRRCKGIIAKALSRLRCRTPFIDKVIFLCANHEAAKSWGANAEAMSDEALRRLQYKCRVRKRFESLLSLINADNRAYAQEHCMPQQTKEIALRSAALIKSGEAMFGYKLPIKPSRISRIIGNSDPKSIAKVTEKLLDKVFAEPRLSREQLAEMAKTFKERQITF